MSLNAKPVSRYGVYLLPLAAGWEPLAVALRDIYAKRVASLPWIPPEWIAHIAAINGQYDVAMNQRAVVLIANAQTLSTYGFPAFLDTPAKRTVWGEIGTEIKTAYDAYARSKAEEGRMTLAYLYADIDFWNRAIAIANVLALPVTIGKTVVEQGTKFLAFPALLAIGIFLAYGFAQKERRHARQD